MSGAGGSLAFPFRHPAWLRRVLVGAALDAVPVAFFLPFALIAARHRHVFPWPAVALIPLAAAFGLAARFLVLGYLGRAAREVLDGTSTGLPPWNRMGDDLLLGLKLWLVAIALFLPAVAATTILALLVMVLASAKVAWLPVILIGPPALLATLGYLPAALLAMVAEGEAAAAFDLDRVAGAVGRAFGPYAIAFLVALGAEIFAQFGLVLCCVGIFATRFVGHCVAVHAFATAYAQGRRAGVRPGEGAPADPAAGL